MLCELRLTSKCFVNDAMLSQSYLLTKLGKGNIKGNKDKVKVNSLGKLFSASELPVSFSVATAMKPKLNYTKYAPIRILGVILLEIT